MCGIAGYWDLKQRDSAEQLTAVVTAMRETLIHRGPDDANNWVDAEDGIAFGHRRLAILDLTSQGQQPMASNSQRYVIVFNGEIYNHAEIKQQLIAAGDAPLWRGHSDTEIILAAFEAWGVKNALESFVGMFAIALWDKQEKLLYLMRDRMGEKPLYYGWVKDYLVFGSELKSLKAHHAWQAEIDHDALGLMMRYNCIPAPYTIYKNIHKLQPGHYLVINQEQQIRDHVYWDLKNIISQAEPHNFTDRQQAIDALEFKLLRAVKQQMVADVPLGAFLSGGIDSSTIVALMQAQSTQPVKTFTIGFDDVNYNEAEQAKAIATHLHTEHTELYLTAEQTRAIIPDLANFYDEPFADASQLPTYIVAKLTRQHVKVSLSGDGGDELFAGYNRYTWVPAIWNKISLLPKPARLAISKLLLTLAPATWDKLFAFLGPILPGAIKQRNPGDKIHKLARILNSPSEEVIYHKLISHWYGNEVLVASAQASNKLLIDLSKDISAKRSFTESMMYIDSQRYLPDDILVKVDRAAMAVSLETRIPFLDHRVVEYAWSLPLDFKVYHGQNKWILRQILQRYVPNELVERPKMGFGVPIDSWLRGPLKEWAHDLLSNSMLAKHGLLNNTLIQQKWQEHLSGVRNWQYHLWDVLMFQTWYEANHG